MDKTIRINHNTYPRKKIASTSLYMNRAYPSRYDRCTFDRFNAIIANDQIMKNYYMWKMGFNPRTEQHDMLHTCRQSVLFAELINIDQEAYHKETDRMFDEFHAKHRQAIDEYNAKVDEIIARIQALKSWYYYIPFEGENYGLIQRIVDGVHRENDCYGRMMFISSKSSKYICGRCRGWKGKENARCLCDLKPVYTKVIHRCDKCKLVSTTIR